MRQQLLQKRAQLRKGIRNINWLFDGLCLYLPQKNKQVCDVSFLIELDSIYVYTFLVVATNEKF